MNGETKSFLIGNAKSNYLRITVLGRMHEGCSDYWDGNWVDSHMQLRVGEFLGDVKKAALRINEIELFYNELKALYKPLKGEACFSSMEDWLSMKITGDGLGHFEALCHVRDRAGIGNRLEFILNFDQTQIPKIISSLEEILQTYPIQGG